MVHTGPLRPIRNLCCGTDDGHQPDCWTLDPAQLPWYPGWWKAFRSQSAFPTHRCEARTENLHSYGGRCELTAHESYCDHALERGMDTPRWSTRWTS